jgi:hypothetical protein
LSVDLTKIRIAVGLEQIKHKKIRIAGFTFMSGIPVCSMADSDGVSWYSSVFSEAS